MKKSKKLILIATSILIILSLYGVLAISCEFYHQKEVVIKEDVHSLAFSSQLNETRQNDGYIYLSDIKAKKAQTDYKSVMNDQSVEGSNISLFIDGKKKIFIKGVSAHASSEVIYDLEGRNYDLFTSYIGIDTAASTIASDGLKFKISVSNDNVTWTEKYASPTTVKVGNDAIYLSIDIKGYRYLKLVADKLRNNSSDHATYGNAKLVKESYVEEPNNTYFFKTVEEYDQIILSHSLTEAIANYELTLLQRTFVKNVGYDLLTSLCDYSTDYKDTLKWLMEDVEALRLYLTGGKLDGPYTKSIKNLVNLYTKHKVDLKNTTVNPISGVVDGNLYLRMMISLSLSHSRDISFWMDTKQLSDAVTKYEIFKDLREKGFVENKIFDDLVVIDMRLVFNSMISDEQIPWLNYYSRLKNTLDPYYYISYRDDYNYLEEQYYSPDNYEKWNSKYHLSEYNIPYVTGQQKLWIMFEEGAVCGGLSKTGTNLNTVRGIPALVLGQPGHAAYMVYSENAEGLGKWGLGNDVSGWPESHWTYEGTMGTGWGTESWAGGHPASAVLLSQAALNDFENFVASEEILFLADVYKVANPTDYTILEELYNTALKKQSVNFNVWKELVSLYVLDKTKTEADFLALSQRAADALTYYPFPMFDLLNLIEKNIKSDLGIAASIVIKNTAIQKASIATADVSIQSSTTANLAKYLLGHNDFRFASFSYNGENAGKIVVSSRFSESTTRLKYSLDGGFTWNETNEKIVALTEEQLNSITQANDIQVGLVGCITTQTIDITQASIPNLIYNNDMENRVIGASKEMEWSFDSIHWTSFSESEPKLEGDISVFVRMGNKATMQASAQAVMKFTKDVIDFHQFYIPIRNLSIHQFSTNQGGEEAKYAIDGNIYTKWHSAWNGSDKDKFITIKMSRPGYISALEYIPRQDANNGRVINALVEVSEDGINWVVAGSSTNWKVDKTSKKVVFEKPIYGSFVRFTGTKTSGEYISAASINLYEDATLLPKAELDSENGTYDLNPKSEEQRDIIVEINKNSEIINRILWNGKTYDLTNPIDQSEIASVAIIKNTEKGYHITFLSSWLKTLEKNAYEFTFLTNIDNQLTYNIHIIDTLVKKDIFETTDGSIKLSDKLDSAYNLKIESNSILSSDLDKFQSYLYNKQVLKNYEISIYDNEAKVNYDNSVQITLNIGSYYANKKVIILHNKNNKIETINSTVDASGKIIFVSSTGLSQFLVITEKEIMIDPTPELPIKPNKPVTPIPEKPVTGETKPNTPEKPTIPEVSNPDNSKPDKNETEKPSTDNSNNDKNPENENKQEDKKQDKTFMIVLIVIIGIASIGIIVFLVNKFSDK